MTAQTSPVSLFKFNDQDIRVVTLDGAPWFVARDVCDVLGFVSGNGAGSTARYLYGLEDDERQLVTRHKVENPDLCGFPTRGATCISESGLYKLAMKSRTQTSKDFQDWIAEVVLPSIRQDSEGRYCLNDLHKAAGGEERHAPNRFFRTDAAEALVNELLQAPDLASEPLKHIRAGRPVRRHLRPEGTRLCLRYVGVARLPPQGHPVLRQGREGRRGGGG